MGRDTTGTARDKQLQPGRRTGNPWGENVTAGDNTGIIGQTTSFKY